MVRDERGDHKSVRAGRHIVVEMKKRGMFSLVWGATIQMTTRCQVCQSRFLMRQFW